MNVSEKFQKFKLLLSTHTKQNHLPTIIWCRDLIFLQLTTPNRVHATIAENHVSLSLDDASPQPAQGFIDESELRLIDMNSIWVSRWDTEHSDVNYLFFYPLQIICMFFLPEFQTRISQMRLRGLLPSKYRLTGAIQNIYGGSHIPLLYVQANVEYF